MLMILRQVEPVHPNNLPAELSAPPLSIYKTLLSLLDVRAGDKMNRGAEGKEIVRCTTDGFPKLSGQARQSLHGISAGVLAPLLTLTNLEPTLAEPWGLGQTVDQSLCQTDGTPLS